MQELELLNIGLLAGIMSGFFGVGGGTITVPLLMAIGLDIRHAIGISSFQMVFTSIFGSYLNHKKSVFDIKSNIPFLFGGAIGGAFGGFLMSRSSPFWLTVIMMFFVFITAVKLFVSNPSPEGEKRGSAFIYVALGFAVGSLGGLIGIGGALILTPILVGYLNFSLKEAIGVSLFFVISSSIFAFSSIYLSGFVDIRAGLLVAAPSLVGVAVGIYLAQKTTPQRHKLLLVILYIIITAILADKLYITNG